MDLEEQTENNLNMEFCVRAYCQVDTSLTESLLVFKLMKNVATFYSCHLFLSRPELHCLLCSAGGNWWQSICTLHLQGSSASLQSSCGTLGWLHSACDTAALLELFCAVRHLLSVSWVCAFFSLFFHFVGAHPWVDFLQCLPGMLSFWALSFSFQKIVLL